MVHAKATARITDSDTGVSSSSVPAITKPSHGGGDRVAQVVPALPDPALLTHTVPRSVPVAPVANVIMGGTFSSVNGHQPLSRRPDADHEEITTGASRQLANRASAAAFRGFQGQHDPIFEENIALRQMLERTQQEAQLAKANSRRSEKAAITLQRQNQDLARENASQAEQLRDCKNQLFRIQPVQNEPDETIAELYRKLCSTISDFAELRFGELPGCVEKLKSVAEHHGGACIEQAIPRGAAAVIKKWPNSESASMAAFIFEILQSLTIGEDSNLFTQEDGVPKILADLTATMASMTPARGKQATDYWAAEAFRALKQNNRLLQDHNAIVENDVHCSTALLLSILPESIAIESVSRQVRKIFDAALELEWARRCSSKKYTMASPTLGQLTHAGRHVLFNDDLQHVTVVSARTGITYQPGQLLTSDPFEAVATPLYEVFPELLVTTDSDEAVSLCKATWLAAVHKRVEQDGVEY